MNDWNERQQKEDSKNSKLAKCLLCDDYTNEPLEGNTVVMHAYCYSMDILGTPCNLKVSYP